MRRTLIITAALSLLGPSAFALKEWYEYYEEAEAHIAAGRCKEAIAALAHARQIKPRSEYQARTYGIGFKDYFPYYYEGVCAFRMGDHAAALKLFTAEEQQGAIRKDERRYRELTHLRSEAQAKALEETAAADRRTHARAALEEVQRLRRESEEQYKGGRLEEALAALAAAGQAAESLDLGTLQQIQERYRQIDAELKRRKEQAEQTQRTERLLADGRRLLEEKPVDAKVRFDEVLRLDPRSAAAAAGKAEAEQRIMAATTRQEREAAFRQGKSLLEAGQHERALAPLAQAAADPRNLEARRLLEQAQRTLDGMRRQKDLRLQIEALLAESEGLLADRKYSHAMVRLNRLVELDPTSIKAQERLRFAERMTGDELWEKVFPNQAPMVSLSVTPPAELAAPSVAIIGVALDDRGLARIQYLQGGRVVEEKSFSPDRQSGEFPRSERIEHVFQLEEGSNQLSVAAYDARGLARLESFGVNRRLRFYETRAFLPSAAAAAVGVLGLAIGAQRLRRQRALRSRFNPYIAGAPVMDTEMFFGRERLLARIMNVLHHNSLMITGERRIGKTTLLYHLQQALLADQGTDYRFFPVFTDLQGVSEEDFFHAIMADVVESLRPSGATLTALRYRAEEEHGYDGRDFSHDLQRVIEELKSRTHLKVKLVLLIDEVDVLNEFSERVNQRLRSIFMKTFSEHLVAVMSGVGIRRIWNSEGSPWYNFFDEIELSALSREEAEALIREPVGGVFRYQPEAVERILEWSQLKPYVIQRFCIHAVNRMLEHDRTRITLEDVAAVREAVLLERGDDATPDGRHPGLGVAVAD